MLLRFNCLYANAARSRIIKVLRYVCVVRTLSV